MNSELYLIFAEIRISKYGQLYWFLVDVRGGFCCIVLVLWVPSFIRSTTLTPRWWHQWRWQWWRLKLSWQRWLWVWWRRHRQWWWRRWGRRWRRCHWRGGQWWWWQLTQLFSYAFHFICGTACVLGGSCGSGINVLTLSNHPIFLTWLFDFYSLVLAWSVANLDLLIYFRVWTCDMGSDLYLYSCDQKLKGCLWKDESEGTCLRLRQPDSMKTIVAGTTARPHLWLSCLLWFVVCGVQINEKVPKKEVIAHIKHQCLKN